MEMKFLSAVSAETLFWVSACLVAVGFTACFFLSVYKAYYGLKKRAWFSIVAAACCAALKARAYLIGGRDFSPLLFFLCAVLALPLYFIRVKTPNDRAEDEKRRNFVRFLDESVSRERARVDFSSAQKKERDNFSAPVEKIVAEPEKNAAAEELDFSHVKSVLNRLEPADLSYADRRQIHELEIALYAAEGGDRSKETKVRINEGLGNLLKIMAKHGV